MQFQKGSEIFKGAITLMNCLGTLLPYEYTNSREEYLACRTSAWLGINLNNTPVFDVQGPDAAKFFNKYCVNRDFSLMEPGQSKHALICNEKGQLLADGVVMKKENDLYRTYWMAPVLQYFLLDSGMNATGEYKQDEYFYQIDGPKSLEILEEATGTDLHDIRFAKNKTVKICGTDMVVHRLGMSGCLAYEVHGAAKDAEVAYKRIREVLESYGGKPQGVRNYSIMNHTPAGYPNQFQHYAYPLLSSYEGLTEFAKKYCAIFPLVGSAMNDPEAYYVTPYDIGWGYLVNFRHEFQGKEALLQAKAAQKRRPVTLEWNADDVADVFKSNFLGQDVEPYDPIEPYTILNVDAMTQGDYVMDEKDRIIGIALGRTYAFYERRMISLAYIEKEYAEEGKELIVLWGNPDHRQKKIRAKVAAFPYYHEEYRNETFDVSKIPTLEEKRRK